MAVCGRRHSRIDSEEAAEIDLAISLDLQAFDSAPAHRALRYVAHRHAGVEAATGTGQYIDVAMAATLMAVNERAHVDLNDAELGDEPAILGATDCPFFRGPGGEHFTVATSLVGSRTFPSYLRAMRRADLADDPRFATRS